MFRKSHIFSMLGRSLSKKKHQSGAELVEVSLVVGYFIFIIIVMIEMGNYLFAYNVTSAIAREALRYSVVRGEKANQDPTRNQGIIPDAPGDLATFRNRVQGFVDNHNVLPGGFSANVEWGNGSNALNNPISVTISYQYEPITNLANFFSRTISHTSEGRFVY